MLTEYTGDSSFERFRAGIDVPRARIVAAADLAGVPVKQITSLSYGYFRKVVLSYETSGGRQLIGKAAFHPHSVRQLQTERAGWAATGQRLRALVTLPCGGAFLVRDRQHGYPGGTLTFFRRLAPPFSGDISPVARETFAARLAMAPLPPAQDTHTGISHFADATVPASKSHGDFVYWNCVRSHGKIHAVDYESFSDTRVAGYDLWYWHMLPVARWAVRSRRQAIVVQLLMHIAPLLWTRRILPADPSLATVAFDRHPAWAATLALTLLDHSHRMKSEHALPDIVALIGSDALALRRAVCDFYDGLVDRLREAI